MLALLALIFASQPLWAQKTLQQRPRDFDPSQQRLDSILLIIKPGLPDSVKARLYFEAARSTYKSDTAIKYANKILEYCRPDDHYYVAYANRILGMGYFLKHDLRKKIYQPCVNIHRHTVLHRCHNGLFYDFSAVGKLSFVVSGNARHRKPDFD